MDLFRGSLVSNTIEARFRLWGAAMLALVLAFAVLVLPRLHAETSIFALLPADQRDAGAEQALNAYTDQLSRNSLFLVGAADFDTARRAAQAFADALQASGQFAQVRLSLDRLLAAGARADLPWRGYLLAARQREWLEQGQIERLHAEAQRAFYTPAGFMRPFNASEDPLGLLSAFVTSQRPPAGKARLRQDVLAVDAAGGAYVMLVAQTAASAFSVATEEAAGRAIAQARGAAARAGATEVVGSGVIQHAAAAVAQSKREMSLFSGLSLAGTVLLVLLMFRSPRPLLLTVLAMALGGIAGLSACWWVFGQVHLVTLVFGSSLIGCSVDYAIFFFADRFRDPAGWRPELAPAYVTPGIALGYMTTALSYGAMLLAPFPGLRQIALFSSVGLGVSCGCVLFLLPRLARSWPLPPQALPLRLCQRLAALPRLTSPRLRLALAALAAVVVAGGLSRLQFLDDVRALQSSPPPLLHQELRVRELLGQAADRRFLLVRGDSAEQVLQREEDLRRRLAPLLADGRLGQLLAVSSALPSLRTQQSDHALLARTVYAPDGLLPRFLRELGYDQAAIGRQLAAFDGSGPLRPEEFFAGAASEPYRPLWLGQVGGGWASAVTLFDLRDPAALAQAVAGLPGVRLIDKIADISDVLQRYRRIALLLILAVYAVIGLLMSRRYGFAGAAALVLSPAGGGLVATALLAWAGVPLNLFHVLALLLVLGMGADYAIFLREARGDEGPAMLAVVLAMLTAALSFGLLSFSSTPFIRAIGQVQALGIFIALLLALALRPPRAAAHA
ncbi:MAG TPA: MMPL family transporter [Nevskia sp.]|nr:MMPL family transporter [Nevskia sp.]